MKIRASVVKVQDDNSKIRGYADLAIENCCVLKGTRIIEGKDGELFVSYPQKPVYKDGQPKLTPEGKQVYTDVYYANQKEINDAIKALVLEAYNSEEGYAYINPEKGEFTKANIEPSLHKCNGETVKAAGQLLIGGYMKVKDVFVNLRSDEKGDKFLAVSYPHYKSGDEFKDFVEPMEKGTMWDSKEQTEKNYNFKRAVEGAMKKQTCEYHPELAEVLKKEQPSLEDKLADAKATASEAKDSKAQVAEKEAAM